MSESRHLDYSAGGSCIFDTHTSGPEDKSPLHMISDELLAYYVECEAELKRIRAVSYVLPAR